MARVLAFVMRLRTRGCTAGGTAPPRPAPPRGRAARRATVADRRRDASSAAAPVDQTSGARTPHDHRDGSLDTEPGRTPTACPRGAVKPSRLGASSAVPVGVVGDRRDAGRAAARGRARPAHRRQHHRRAADPAGRRCTCSRPAGLRRSSRRCCWSRRCSGWRSTSARPAWCCSTATPARSSTPSATSSSAARSSSAWSIFLILVVIQFVVITNGAGRVAEVGARFTLDAMPGKQMAIDADLNAGLIDEDEARAPPRRGRRRGRLLRRDGRRLEVRQGRRHRRHRHHARQPHRRLRDRRGPEAACRSPTRSRTYTLLTIGDGLVSQIPALLISVATGLIVTRATGDARHGHRPRRAARRRQQQPMRIAGFGALGALPDPGPARSCRSCSPAAPC